MSAALIADKLRASLLQAAIQGKLTKQLAEDGDARDLLKAIEVEKARLIEEKIIKKEKPLPPITEDEIPFEIPENWAWVRLGEVSIIGAGNTPKANELNNKDGAPYFKVSDMNTIGNEKFMHVANSYVSNDYTGKLIVLNSIIYPKNGGALLTNKRRITTRECLIDLNTGFCSPYISNIEFFYFWFLTLDLKQYYTGTAVPTVASGIIKQMAIPLPPLAEQERIVEAIETALAKIDKLKADETKLYDIQKAFPNKLRASLLQSAIQGQLTEQLPEDGNARDLLKEIEDEKAQLIEEKIIKKEKPLPPITDEEIPFEIPENWVWVRLGDIGIWGSGATPNRSNINYYKSGTHSWLKTGDLTDGYIYEIPEKITDLAIKETSVKLLPVDAVLIAMYGATIGKLGILTQESTTNQACCGCIPYKGIFNRYLFYFLLFNRENFIAMGAGGAQPNISKEKIVNTTIPLPPFAEQQRIVEKLDEILGKVDGLRKIAE